MKPLCYFAALSALVAISGCSKSNNNYATGDDKTAKITNTRHWKGHYHGYAKGDTLLHPSDLSKTEWAKSLERAVDTTEAAVKINEKTISLNGIQMNFSLASDAATYIFDTTSQGTADRTSLTWYTANDSMVFVFHKVSGQNPTNGKYYYNNDTLHTVNP